jgi:hypothetical protein
MSNPRQSETWRTKSNHGPKHILVNSKTPRDSVRCNFPVTIDPRTEPRVFGDETVEIGRKQVEHTDVALQLLPKNAMHLDLVRALKGSSSVQIRTPRAAETYPATAFFGDNGHAFTASELTERKSAEETKKGAETSLLAVLAFRSKHHFRQYPRGSDERKPAPGGVNEFVESPHLIVAVAEIIEVQITSGYDCVLKMIQDELGGRIKICVENRDEHLMRRKLVAG